MAKTFITIKKSKITLHSSNKYIQVTKPYRNSWCDLLKYIFIIFKMVISSYYNAVL